MNKPRIQFRSVALLACFVGRAGCGQHEPAQVAAAETNGETVAPPPAEAVAQIDTTDVRARIRYLASDELQGRATPSPGLTMAADYIASEFASFGLEPGGESGTFLQWYALQTDNGEARAQNVIGILRGSDPALRDSYIVYSAHMDHVGVGRPNAQGDSIYNGADDDASGTTAIIEIAQAFASLPERPKRSIAFVAVSGEELGLNGSQAFVSAGPIPAGQMIANINIDMIGRNSPDTLVAIGLNYSTIGDRAIAVARSNPELGLAVVNDPWPDERFFFRSDHYNFARAGVPAVFFFSGVHEDYHRPSDEPEKINADKAARIARLAFRLGYEIAQSTTAPAWTAAGRAAMSNGGG